MTKSPQTDNQSLSQYAAAIGIDWADQKHDVSLLDLETPDPVAVHSVIEATPKALMSWVRSLQQRFGGNKIAVAVEQKRGSLIHFLSAFEFIDIYPVPTAALKKLREALYPSGNKSDPNDSQLALDLLTKHTDRLRLMKPESAEIRELAALCEDRRRLVDERTAKLQALRDACKGYFPLIVELFDFQSPVLCRFLLRWDTLEKLQKARPATLRKFFYANRCRGDVIERRLAAIKAATALTRDPGVVNPLRRRVEVLSKQIIALFEDITPYEARIGELFEALPSAAVFKSLPGAGKAMAPRLAAAFGEDRSKFRSAADIQNYSATSPVTKRSGQSSHVLYRWAAPTFLRQSFVEWANHSRKHSRWAGAYYALCLERGDRHNTALRKLAWKWQRILFRLWTTGQTYDEEIYLRSLVKHGSPIIAKLAPLEDAA